MERLAPLRAGDTKPISEHEKRELDGELGRWRAVEGRRKFIRESMWGVVRDVLPEDRSVAGVRVCSWGVLRGGVGC